MGLRAPACATGDFCERGRGQGFGLPHSGGHDDARKSAQTILGSEKCALNPVCPVPGVWVACPRFRADRHYPHVGLSALRAAHPYPMNDAPDASGAPLRRKGYGFLLRQANKFERASIAREWAGVFMVSLILHIRLSYSFRLVLSFSPNSCCWSESEAGTGTGIRPAPVGDRLFLY